MPSTSLKIIEADVVRMIHEFMERRDLNMSMLSLERETGVVNGDHSDDLLFLRQLILDGQWDDAIDFVQPLADVDGFDMRAYHYAVQRHKYLELLCLKSEPGAVLSYEVAVDKIVRCLATLEELAPTRHDYSQLCLLLALPRLSEHADYQMWNPSSARIQCFTEVRPLVERFLPAERHDKKVRPGMAKHDRLMQLLVKGLLYESCVDYCQHKAISSDNDCTDIKLAPLLSGGSGSEGIGDADMSLLSWLQAVSPQAFACPFQQMALRVEVTVLEKPALEGSWTEQILLTPIKPKMFPHSAISATRPRSADFMSRSLNPQYDGLAYGLGQPRDTENGPPGMMSRSFAGFHLATPSKAGVAMTTSVERLFSGDNLEVNQLNNSQTSQDEYAIDSSNASPIASPRLSPRESSSGLHRNAAMGNRTFVSKDAHRNSPRRNVSQRKADNVNNSRSMDTHQDKPRDTAAIRLSADSRTSTPRVSATPPRCMSPQRGHTPPPPPHTPPMVHTPKRHTPTDSSPPGSGELYREYQRQRLRLTKQLEEQEERRARYEKQLLATDTQYEDDTPEKSGSDAGSMHLSYLDTTPTAHGELRNAKRTADNEQDKESDLPCFVAVSRLEDTQAIRAVALNPCNGNTYAVGTNSKTLYICHFPDMQNLRRDHKACAASVSFKRSKHHKGSIYSIAWNPLGDLIATGSNDKTIRLMQYDADTHAITGSDRELCFHDGTVRDLVFMQDTTNRSSLLVSGGAGDCNIYVSDCSTGTPVRVMSGHTGHIYALHTWGGCMFVSGSADKTARVWDVRTPAAINTIPSSGAGSAFASLCVDTSGRLLASGHEDSSCMLWDIRGHRTLQSFHVHTSDVRTVRFSTATNYLLSASYDQKVVLTDLHGDLLQPLPTVVVAQHKDKVIQCRWHPHEMAFVTTSADKTAICWALSTP